MFNLFQNLKNFKADSTSMITSRGYLEKDMLRIQRPLAFLKTIEGFTVMTLP